MNSTLYVGNLSPTVNEEDLRQLFSRTGAVAEVRLMLDPTTHESRGSAFVTMATPELAAAAMRELHSYHLEGRYITVTEARPPEEPKGLMSEGFDLQSMSFRPGAPAAKSRQRSTGRSHRRSRGRRR